MLEASITNDFENINISQRDLKGFIFEKRVDNVLKDIGIEYVSNPLQDITLWKRHQGIGSDFKIPLWNWEIEAKYSDAKIFPSWIKRDYIPRFSKNSFKVIVHNKNMKLTNSSLELCFLYDIYLVEIGYLRYVLKAEIKARSRANKLLEAENSKKQNIRREDSEMVEEDSEIEGLEPISSKSSATFKDKFKTKLRSAFMNLLSEMLLSKIVDRRTSKKGFSWL
jgi:hypothetical protein